MKRFVPTALTALVALTLSAGAAFAQDQAPAPAQDPIVVAQVKKRAAPAVRNTGTHVYLLRGFMDIFSTGMDDLGVKLNRSGIRASVHGHAEYHSLADSIGERHRQGIRENVVIIGHSLGANAAFQMADRLGDFGVTVPLIITYDPTAMMSVGSNVTRVVNFFSSTNGWGAPIARGAGFRGNLANVDLSRRGEIGHTDIDKSPALHSQSISYIRSIGGGGRATSATAKPKTEAKDSESKKADDTKAATTTPAAATTSDESKSAVSNTSPASTASVPAASAGSGSASTAPRVIDATPATAAKPASAAVPAVNDALPASTASATPASAAAPAPSVPASTGSASASAVVPATAPASSPNN